MPAGWIGPAVALQFRRRRRRLAQFGPNLRSSGVAKHYHCYCCRCYYYSGWLSLDMAQFIKRRARGFSDGAGAATTRGSRIAGRAPMRVKSGPLPCAALSLSVPVSEQRAVLVRVCKCMGIASWLATRQFGRAGPKLAAITHYRLAAAAHCCAPIMVGFGGTRTLSTSGSRTTLGKS